jgi:C4-dicarboxylate-specific signal transduction histidine kinase
VARPLREQFVLATVLLFVPVAAAITWSAALTYNEQVRELAREAGVLASTVGAFVDHGAPEAADEKASLDDFLGKIPLPSGSEVMVTDRDGTIVTDVSQPGATRAGRTYGTAKVARLPWTVSVGIPTAVAWTRTSPVYVRNLGLSALATLVVLVIEALLMRRWLRSLAHLERSADRVGSGDLRTPPHAPMPSREVENVRDAFRGMVDKLREAREAIARQVAEERRMREEVQSLQRQVIRQERLAAIGVLVSGIAHELNNPLQAIAGFAELLERDARVAPDIRSDLSLIQRESARASAIIRNLSRFGRQQNSSPSPVQLREVVASVVELRQRKLQEQNIVLEIDEHSRLAALVVFTELQQVLLNFIINAEQAVLARPESARRVTIRTTDQGGRVRLEVEDTGGGVPVEHESKLFQPFFSTKPAGEGTGLGLSVSYDIMKALGGTIGYRRSDGHGAIFYFELPGVAPTEQGEPAREAPAPHE